MAEPVISSTSEFVGSSTSLRPQREYPSLELRLESADHEYLLYGVDETAISPG